MDILCYATTADAVETAAYMVRGDEVNHLAITHESGSEALNLTDIVFGHIMANHDSGQTTTTQKNKIRENKIENNGR